MCKHTWSEVSGRSALSASAHRSSCSPLYYNKSETFACFFLQPPSPCPAQTRCTSRWCSCFHSWRTPAFLKYESSRVFKSSKKCELGRCVCVSPACSGGSGFIYACGLSLRDVRQVCLFVVTCFKLQRHAASHSEKSVIQTGNKCFQITKNKHKLQRPSNNWRKENYINILWFDFITLLWARQLSWSESSWWTLIFSVSTFAAVKAAHLFGIVSI